MTQGKPRWEDVPLEYDWIAMDENWRWDAYVGKPYSVGKCWLIGDRRSGHMLVKNDDSRLPSAHWRSTLEPRPTPQDEGAATGVIDLMNRHKDTWRDMPEAYWFQRLVGELGELGCSLANDHEHPPDWELKQIAAICLNWLDMRLALTPIQPEPAPLLCPVCEGEIELRSEHSFFVICHKFPTGCVLSSAVLRCDTREWAEARLRGQS